MARLDLEKLAEELATKVRPDFEREIEKARAEGYRAGIEAAAKVHADASAEFARRAERLRNEEPDRVLIAEHREDMAQFHVRWAEKVRALSAPAATCSCPCINHPSGNCGCNCVRHPGKVVEP